MCSAFSLLGAIWLHLCSMNDQKLHRSGKTQSILKYSTKSLKSYRGIGTKNVLMRLIRNCKCKESLQVPGKTLDRNTSMVFFHLCHRRNKNKTKTPTSPISKTVKDCAYQLWFIWNNTTISQNNNNVCPPKSLQNWYFCELLVKLHW